MRNTILLGSLLLMSACATNSATMRGSVVVQVQPDEVRVHVTEGSAQPGEHVALRQRVCHHNRGRAANVNCHMEVAANGEVVQQRSDGDSLVRLEHAVSAHPGDELIDTATR